MDDMCMYMVHINLTPLTIKCQPLHIHFTDAEWHYLIK